MQTSDRQKGNEAGRQTKGRMETEMKRERQNADIG